MVTYETPSEISLGGAFSMFVFAQAASNIRDRAKTISIFLTNCMSPHLLNMFQLKRFFARAETFNKINKNFLIC